jgi:hypothetical protein
MDRIPTKPIYPQVLVLGDLAFENVLIPERTLARDTTEKHSDYVGATIIRDVIVRALESTDSSANASVGAQVHPRSTTKPDDFRAQLRELIAVFGQFPRKSQGNRTDTVWRVRNTYRLPQDSKKPEDYESYLERNILECPTPEILVIYEEDKQFRNSFDKLARSRKWESSKRIDKCLTPTLIIGLAEDVDKTSIQTAKRVFGVGSTVALVTADGLRREGLDIASHASVEQTVHDLSRCLTQQPVKEILALCSHLIVLLEDSGVLCIHKSSREGTIHFSPNFDRVAQTHKSKYGKVPGRMAATLGSIVRAVCKAEGPDIGSLDLAPALRLSVAAYDRMFEKGFSKEKPFETAKSVLSADERRNLRDTLNSDASRRVFLISSLKFDTDPESLKDWSRLDSLDRVDIAKAIVQNGVEKASRHPRTKDETPADEWWPVAEIACPFMQVGRLQTFDKVEVERLANLAKLISKYHDDPKWVTPLSIAVFGPPGAGKSFAVKQLMKTVNPTIKDSSILTFNLAQFNSLELLTEAFHQVQDQVLFSDDVPLVIFDEFDSVFQGSSLGWLKYFLAPMEDGIFRGQSSNYKVGRAVFLFAGGTASSFDEFASREVSPSKRKARSRRPEKERTPKIDTKAVKLPDFVSRLMAHLDVLGINPPSDSQLETDRERTRRRVRRATLLRSLLDEFASPIVDPTGTAHIADEVVADFLDEKVIYRNEARSMKAIVRGSRLIGNQFLRASLPSRSVIDLHTEHWPFQLPDHSARGTR